MFSDQQALTLRYRMVGQRVHSHRHTKVLQVVQKLAEIAKLLERDALLLLDSIQEPIEEHVVLVRVQVRVAQQDLSKIHLSDGNVALRELVELQLEHLSLQIVHKLVEALVVQILVALASEKVHLQRGVDLVLALQPLFVLDVLAECVVIINT